MKPTQEWPSVIETKLPDSTEIYTEPINRRKSRKPIKEHKFIEHHRYHQIQYFEQDVASYHARHPFHRKIERKTKSNRFTAIDMKHACIALLQYK